MRVVCDNCGATYKIPEHKLTREVNKATCRKCSHQMIIRKPGIGAAVVSSANPFDDAESTQITSAAELEARARAQQSARSGDDVPPTVVSDQVEQTVPNQGPSRGAPRAPAPPPPPTHASIAPKPTTQAPTAGATAAPPQAAGVSLQHVAASHDPSGDLTWVLMACFGVVIGALLVQLAPNALLVAAGLTLVFGSALVSMLILVTSDRGRKKAKVGISMVGGGFLAVLGALAMTCAGGLGDLGSQLGLPVADAVAEAAGGEDDEFAQLGGTEAPDGAHEAEEDPEVEEPDAAEDAVALLEEDEPVEDTEPEPEPEPEPASEPQVEVTRRTAEPVSRSTSSGSSTSTRSSTTSTRSSSTSGSTSGSSSSGSSGPQGVPVTVLDTMLKNNKGVKQCFGLYRQETGSLPRGRITVRMVIQPSGQASSARIDGGQYSGTSLDTCLGSAVRKISFPPWDGTESATYYYPFIL